MNDRNVTRTLWWRIAAGVACGLAAFTLNRIPAPMLSPESPEFAFGGAFVLFAFWQLGLVPGLVAAIIGYASRIGLPEVTLAIMAMYAVEGYVVARLAHRAKSLVVADVAFWLTGGAVLDFLVYRSWMGVSTDYVLLLLVKQLLNGVMNAVLADGASRLTAVRRWTGAPALAQRSWGEVLFDRTVPVVMLPMTIIVLLLARASFSAELNRTAADLRRGAAAAERAAGQFLRRREATVRELVDAIEPHDAGFEQRVQQRLYEFHAAHHEFLNVFVTDEAGTVIAGSPVEGKTGIVTRGRSLARRPYFDEARASRRTAFGELVLGTLHMRRTGVEPILPMAVPIAGPRGTFGGVVMAAIDAWTLRAILAAGESDGAGGAQLIDRAGRVVASTEPAWLPGAPRGPELAGTGRLAMPVALFATSGASYVDRLGIDPRLTITQPVAGYPFVVLVDTPLSTVHRALISTCLALIALMLAALLSVYAVARTLGAQLAKPLSSIGTVARDIAEGHSVPSDALAAFEASNVVEIRALARQLAVMDAALRQRREADATAVAQSEQRYRETLEQLVQAQKMEGIGRLAGGIAHDFNNLLTPILGYSDLAMASVPEGNPARHDLALVRTAAMRAKEVVAQLLAFGRAQVLDVQRIDLAEAVAEFEPLLRRSLGAGIELSVIVEPGIVVVADQSKVQQVLMNLVINAADAMPSGGEVKVRVGILDVASPDMAGSEPLAPGSYGTIVVSDSGTGMDDETRRRAFDPFFTTKPRGKGTGLGLSTAYGIARQHKGTISVQSSPGVGTQMSVLLPLAAPAPQVRREAPPAPDLSRGTVAAPADVASATLLIAEDESSVRELVRAALSRVGYRILTARDGDEALTRAAAHQGRIDLLLTDVVMPGMNGRELARRIRAVRPDARVLFMSGHAADVVAADGALVGNAALLHKPFTTDELVERVRQALAT